VNVVRFIFAAALLAGGCASPTPSPSATVVSTSSPAQSPRSGVASDVGGRYRLELDLPRTTWAAGDPVDGSASLSVSGSGAVKVWGSGSLLGFSYDEVGGLDRHMDWLDDLTCGPYLLTPGQPVVSPLEKGGDWDPAASNAGFYASFGADPRVHLPAGGWRISALAGFDDAVDCNHLGGEHNLLATIVVHVTN
jgi:hypothetical protein